MTTQDGEMSDEKEPDSNKVTACRTFEEIDAQVFPGSGWGARGSKRAAGERHRRMSPPTVETYRPTSDLVAKHSRVRYLRAARAWLPGDRSARRSSRQNRANTQTGEGSTCQTLAAKARTQ
jgi:hypothetical protein